MFDLPHSPTMSDMSKRPGTRDIGCVDRSDLASFDAVLFDLSGTTVDDAYIGVGFAAVAREMHRRWGIDEARAAEAMHPALRDQLVRWANRPYFPMLDSMVAAFDAVVTAAGQRATADELCGLDAIFWEHAVPAATITAGVRETLARLRAAGVRTGILSFADVGPFRALLEHTGLARLTDVELCSQEANSVKPDPRIFRQALAVVGVAPERSLFVGDSIDSDIVGANRVGMATALVTGRPFSITAPDERHRVDQDRDRHPTYRITHLAEVVDLALAPQSPTTKARIGPAHDERLRSG